MRAGVLPQKRTAKYANATMISQKYALTTQNSILLMQEKAVLSTTKGLLMAYRDEPTRLRDKEIKELNWRAACKQEHKKEHE